MVQTTKLGYREWLRINVVFWVTAQVFTISYAILASVIWVLDLPGSTVLLVVVFLFAYGALGHHVYARIDRAYRSLVTPGQQLDQTGD